MLKRKRPRSERHGDKGQEGRGAWEGRNGAGEERRGEERRERRSSATIGSRQSGCFLAIDPTSFAEEGDSDPGLRYGVFNEVSTPPYCTSSYL